mgnify:CR=1 FL=1
MTVILWDIDGPLNPYLAGWDDRMVVHGTDYNQGRFLPHHGSWMEEYLNLGVTMVWASNWLEDTIAVTELFQLPDFPYIPLEPDGTHATWKLPSVEAYLNRYYPNEPVIWLDDELEEDAYRWATNRGRMMLVKVDPKAGWTEQQHNQMLQFCRDGNH